MKEILQSKEAIKIWIALIIERNIGIKLYNKNIVIHNTNIGKEKRNKNFGNTDLECDQTPLST